MSQFSFHNENSNASQSSRSNLSQPSYRGDRDTTSQSRRTCETAISKSKMTKVRILLDETIFNSTTLALALQKEFSDLTTESESSERFGYIIVPSKIPNLIRWSLVPTELSRNHDPSFVLQYTQPFAFVLLSSGDFVQFLLNSADDLEFPQLGQFLEKTLKQSISEESCPADTRLIIGLLDLDKTILKHQKKLNKNNCNRSIYNLVDAAVTSLIYEYDVEIHRFKKEDELVECLRTLTRLVLSWNSKEQITELDCVMKASREKPDTSLSSLQKEKFELQQTWMAMLQMIPQVSKVKAQSLIKDERFSSFKKLNDCFSNLPPEEGKVLLQYAFGEDKNGVKRNQNKLSKLVYSSMTVTNPDSLLGDST